MFHLRRILLTYIYFLSTRYILTYKKRWSNPSFILNKDGQAHVSIDGEEADLPYTVNKDRKLYVNNQFMGQFTEDYKCLVLTAIFDLELYKIDK